MVKNGIELFYFEILRAHKKDCRPFFTIIFKQKIVVSSVNILSNLFSNIRRLKANGPFHKLFGWNSVLRIYFFSSEMIINCFFLIKILWNMLCLLCNTTQAAENNKVLSEENKILVWKFFKNWHFVQISDEKRKFSTLFQPKSPWNAPVTFSLENFDLY